MIALWRNRAEEARAQASQMKDGSVAQELLLSIAAAYAKALGGELSYEPVQPRGARFTLSLPAARS